MRRVLNQLSSLRPPLLLLILFINFNLTSFCHGGNDGPATSEESNETTETEPFVGPERLPNELFPDVVGVDLSREPPPSPENTQQILTQALESIDPAEPNLHIEHSSKVLARLMTLGQGAELQAYIERIVRRLHVPGDVDSYKIVISPNPLPNASMAGDTMTINLGLLALVNDEDELASVIAHEMTHANPDFMSAANDSEQISGILNSIPDNNRVDGSQREELRADIGALDRLIRAGYNPWGHFQLEKRVTKLDFTLRGSSLMGWLMRTFNSSQAALRATHPVGELRMAVAKAYILHRSARQDLSAQIQNHTALPLGMRFLRRRMQLVTLPLISQWTPHITAGIMILTALAEQAIKDPEFTSHLGSGLRHAISSFLHFRDLVRSKFPDSNLVGILTLPPSFYSLAIVSRAVLTTASHGKDYFLTTVDLRRDFTVSEKDFAKLLHERPHHGTYIRNITATFIGNSQILDALQDLIDHSPNSRVIQDLNGIRLMNYVASQQSRALLHLLGTAEIPKDADDAKQSAYFAYDALGMISDSQLDDPRVIAHIERIQRRFAQLSQADRHHAAYLTKKLDALRYSRSAEATRDPATTIATINSLMDLALRHQAGRMLMQNYSRIIDFVYSPQNSDPELTTRFVSLQNQLGLEGGGILNFPIVMAKLRAAFAGRGRRLALAAHSIATPTKGGAAPLQALRSFMNRFDLIGIRTMLEHRFGGIQQLNDFIVSTVVPNHVSLATLSPEIYSTVMSHPEWIRNRADVDMLLSQEAYWPKSSSAVAEATMQSNRAAGVLLRSVKGRSNHLAYDPGLSERLHLEIINALTKSGELPTDFEGKLNLFNSMVRRGITVVTDQLFSEMYEAGTAQQRDRLEHLLLENDQQIWEPTLRQRVFEEHLRRSPEMEVLMRQSPRATAVERMALLVQVMEKMKKLNPERGIGYRQQIESLSRAILSSESESRYLNMLKTHTGGERSQDLSVRVLSQFLDEALRWPRSEQWELVRFLRNDIPATARVEAEFQAVGTERIRRAFSLLPLDARTAMLDSFLGSPSSLLHGENFRSGWARNITNHILQSATPRSRNVASEVLQAFLHSLEKTGNEPLRSYMLSYLLSNQPEAEGELSAAHTLKRVLEIFGTSGIKIGQFLVATGLLSPEESRVLSVLQDRAQIPDREEIYRDLREILNVHELPYRIENLLGAASLKYAVLATDLRTGKRVVLKVLRQEAIAHTNQEFLQLDAMADFLRSNFGSRYGIFRSIVRASKQAVKRELSLEDEVRRGEVAASEIYHGKSGEGFTIHVPQEKLLAPRLIEAEYMEGVSLRDLPAAQAIDVGRRILSVERSTFFNTAENSGGHFAFCPDRHPGNYRSRILPDGIHLGAIDFGQVIERMTVTERGQVLDLFAVSQILRRTGSTEWGVRKLSEILAISPNVAAKLHSKLRSYFPDRNSQEVTAYFGLLTALEEAGHPPPMEFFDFIRGIVTTRQNADILRENGDTIEILDSPIAQLTSEVQVRVNRFVETMPLSKLEKLRIGLTDLRFNLAETLGQKIRGLAAETTNNAGGVQVGGFCTRERLLEVMTKAHNRLTR